MTFLTASCTTVLPDGAPQWVHLIPAGKIVANDGRRWTNADPAAVAANSTAAIDLVVDYEHQTDWSQENGQPAPAAGWIKKLEARADGVWGLVEWTDKAKAHLMAREYRYLSPTFLYDKARNVVRILRAALTNNPAIHDLPALAHSRKKGNDPMDEEQYLALCQALGLAEGSSVKDVMAAATAGQTAVAGTGAVTTALCTALDLGDDAGIEKITAAITTLKSAARAGQPDPEQFVGMAAFQEQATALKTLQDGLAGNAAAAAVEKAMADGKITPANKDWAVALASKDMASFEAFVEKAPVVIDPAVMMLGDAPAITSALDADQKAMCTALGVSEDAFLKTLNPESA